MRYRLYRPEDFATLYAIEEACFQPPLRFSRGYLRQLIRQSNAAAWIAEDERAMCGFALVEWNRELAETIAYIQTIEVLAEARGRGIGRALLQHLEDSAMVAGASTVWLHVDADNAAAIHLYEARGYGCEGREEDYYGRGRAGLIYARRLSARGDC